MIKQKKDLRLGAAVKYVLKHIDDLTTDEARSLIDALLGDDEQMAISRLHENESRY